MYQQETKSGRGGGAKEITWKGCGQWEGIMLKISHTRTSKAGSHFCYHQGIKGIFGDKTKEHDFSYTCSKNIKSTHACRKVNPNIAERHQVHKCHDHRPQTGHSEQFCVYRPKDVGNLCCSLYWIWKFKWGFTAKNSEVPDLVIFGKQEIPD